MPPNTVARHLFLGDGAGHGDGGVILRKDDTELRKQAVGSVSAAGSVVPHAVAVADPRVGVMVCGVVGPKGDALLCPTLGENLLAAELPAVEEAEHDLGKVLGLEIRTPAAGFGSLGVGLPKRHVDVQRFKKARCQKLAQRQPRRFSDTGAEHIDVFVYVTEFLAGIGVPCAFDIGLNPVFSGSVGHDAYVFSGGHGNQMAHQQLFEPLILPFGGVFGENVKQARIEREIAFGDGKAYGNRRKGFTHGVKRVRGIRVKRRAKALGGYFPVPDDDEAVKFELVFFHVP